MNILTKIFRFFFPKGGFMKNFYEGQALGKELIKKKKNKKS